MKKSNIYLLTICLLLTFGEASARTEYIGPKPVDLGLSVLWGDKNIIDQNYATMYYYWGGENGLTLIGTDEDYPDNICGTKYDVATTSYGDGWRMPTADEYRELCEKCSKSFSSDGVKFTAANGNSITLGLVGYKKGDNIASDYTYYWTGTKNNAVIFSDVISVSSGDPTQPKLYYRRYASDAFGFNSSGLKDKDKICNYLTSDQYQCAIRPVKDKTGTDATTAYAILNNGILTFYYDSSKGSRTGKKYDVEASYTSNHLPGWASDSLNIKKAVFDSSFAGYYPTSTARWFGGYYNNLTSITGLNYLNTENVTNMDNMFARCKSLKSIDVSKFKTSKVTIMQSMFYGCKSLESLDVSGFDTRNVTNMHAMFYNCSSLQSLDVSGFNTAKVKNMEYMFYGCSTLGSLDVSRFNTGSATNMEAMFYGCSKVTALEVRNFDTSKVTSMGWMFYGCTALNELNISTFNTYNVTNMLAMFYNCENLTEIDISGFNTSNVTDMSFMFRGCSKLKELYMGGFYTSKVTTMQCMFLGCTSLETIYVEENWDVSNVTNSANMFHSCNSLVGGAGTRFSTSHLDKDYARIDGGTSNPGYFTDINATEEAYAVLNNSTLTFYYDSDRSNKTGTVFRIENVYTSPVHYDYDENGVKNDNSLPGWYDEQESITKAVFDTSFKNYAPIATANWFYGCSKLISVEGLGNINTQSVIDMGAMFYNCSSLKTLDFTGFKTNKVALMDWMFGGCSSLDNLDLISFNTANVQTMSQMFKDCYQLKNVNIDSFNTSKVHSMHGMFWNCLMLSEVDTHSFDTSNVTDFGYMFVNCQSIKSLDLRHFDTSKAQKMDYMFSMCNKMSELSISSFATNNVTNMESMFSNCKRLLSIDVINFNTSNVTNMGGLFGGCSSITTLDLRNFNTKKVENMKGMFSNDTSLTTIYASRELWSTEKVTSGGAMFTNCNVLVGGMGTKFDAAHVDYDYAIIDEGSKNPGYLTDKDLLGIEPEPYAVLKDSVLTFYFDYDKESRATNGSIIYDIKEDEVLDLSSRSRPAWHNNFNEYYWIVKAVFDASFANYQPNTIFYWFGDLYNLREIEGMANWNTSKAKDMSHVFFNCKELTCIDLANFDTSEAVYMTDMFSHCEKLTTLDVSHFNTTKVTDMFGMFLGCYSLHSLDLSNFDTSNVKDMEAIFEYCTSLRNLDISSFSTKNVETTSRMFRNCESLSHVDISSLRTEKVKDMSAMFSGCLVLSSIDVTKFDTRNVTNTSDMFNNCVALKELNLQNFNTEKVNDMVRMFYECSNLTTIYTGDEWSTASIKYSYLMFSSCSQLVGGAGTKYDSNNTDHTYAHIDGGPSNPGYFTYKTTGKKGDVNGDGAVDVTDIASIISAMTGQGDETLKKSADVNGDGTVNVADIATVISWMADLTRLQETTFEEQ